MSIDAALVLVVTPVRGAHPGRLPVTERITGVGANSTADVRLPTAPPHGAVVHRGDDAIELLVSSTGSRHRLVPGQSFEADGITMALESTATARNASARSSSSSRPSRRSIRRSERSSSC
jgi:hypothetical protein